jgi:hypothetical protein
MSENMCRYSGDRSEAIVSYLYGDEGGFDAEARRAFDAHLPTCDSCRTELAAFEGVRVALGSWQPPGVNQPVRGTSRPLSVPWWREIPAWAQVAAAMVCLGVGAGFANLDVRYGADGLHVRTGWSTVASAPVAQDRSSTPVSTEAAGRESAPWRADLTALEQRLRTELSRPSPNVSAAAANSAAVANAGSADILRRVRALVQESTRQQQTELALRLAEAVRDVNAQRQADLVRIDRSIGAIQNNTGREMLRQRNEMLNYVSLRTASQRPQ